MMIGRKARYLSEADALAQVAGYCVINDVSERAFQIERGGQWVKGKSAGTFGPIGPWQVTRDEVPDPQNLSRQQFQKFRRWLTILQMIGQQSRAFMSGFSVPGAGLARQRRLRDAAAMTAGPDLTGANRRFARALLRYQPVSAVMLRCTLMRGSRSSACSARISAAIRWHRGGTG